MEYCRQLVIDAIIDGRELSPGALQLIVAVLRGKTNRLGAVYSGHTAEFAMKSDVKGYAPIKGKGRPIGVTNKNVKISLARHFCYLRTEGKLSANDAYKKIEDESDILTAAAMGERPGGGKHLDIDTIKKYITAGKRYIRQEAERNKQLWEISLSTPLITCEGQPTDYELSILAPISK